MRTKKDVLFAAISHITSMHDYISDNGYELRMDEKELVNFLVKQEIDGVIHSYIENVTHDDVCDMIDSHQRILELRTLMM